MVKVKEEAAMAESKPSPTSGTNTSTSTTNTAPRKSRYYHHPSHHQHHNYYHHCTLPPAPDGASTQDSNGSATQPARFYFGPGFEPQTGYTAGPSQAQNSSEYVVFFHVNPGVTISFQIGDNLEILRGPVTVPMVSTNSSPPIAMPVQVPHGHVVQQIVDESGTLRHVILSPQHHAGLLPISSHSQPHFSAGPPNGTNMPPQHYHYPQPPGFPSGPFYFANRPPGEQPLHTHPPGHSPPPTIYKDERTQKQYYKLKKKLQDKQAKSVDSVTGRKDLVNGIRRGKDKGMNSVGTSEDGEESSSVQDDEDSLQYITEILSSVQAPEVSDLSSRCALLQWAAPLRLSEASSNDSNELEIPEADLRYEILLSDKSKEMKYKSIYSGTSLLCRIQDLRPGVEYSVRLQVHLDELQGTASDPLKFTTPPCEPDQPHPPKLLQRTKNTLQLRWNAPNTNGSNILHYILEYDEGKGGEFVELHKTKGHQHNLQKLSPATYYQFRLAAVNEVGKSLYSDTIGYYTSDVAPQQPDPPHLEKAMTNSLHLTWQKRLKVDTYQLQMNDPHNRYGFMIVHNGPEHKYTCINLKRFTDYKFKLRAQNEGGTSNWSEEVTFQTLPDRPKRPSKPIVKGRIHAHSFKLKWEAPNDTGGAEISKYILEVNSGSGYEAVYEGTDTEAICDKLTPGTTYQLRVSCESIGGRSNYSDPCTVTTDAISPGQCPIPRLQGKAKATSITLKLTEPDYNGGAPVIEYEVEMIFSNNSRMLVHKSKEQECIVTNLQAGCEYKFIARAINRIGPGPWSEELITTSGAAPPEAPIPPITTCKSPFHIFVEWKEPPSNGASVLEYRLEMSNSDNEEQFLSVYQGASTWHDIKNLNPFSPYYFRVQACNSAGYGNYSPVSATITPAAPPSAIQMPKYEVTARSITLHWNEPSCNGSPITHYNIEIGDQLISTLEAVNEYTIESLHPETIYKIKIQGVNIIGSGAFSSVLKVATLKLPPVAPRLECIGAGHNYLKLKWGEGKNLDFTQFCVEIENQRTHEYQVAFKGTAFTCKVNKLQELTTYKFRIYASNDAGEGDYSDEYEFTTNISPPASLKAPKIVEVEHKSCLLEWTASRNTTTDPILYLVQVTRLKDQQFKQVYKGPETKCAIENLESGVDYSTRVCPIRVSQQGELPGPFSPIVNFSTIPSEPEKSIRIVQTHATSTSTWHRLKKLLKRFIQMVWSPKTDMPIIIITSLIILLVSLTLSIIVFNALNTK